MSLRFEPLNEFADPPVEQIAVRVVDFNDMES
jgi:hypothetical protein